MKSTEIIKPISMSGAFAHAGTKNSIPTEATGSNLASVEEGFPEITQVPPEDGGLPPLRADFNGMFYLATDQKVYLQNGGIITFSKDVSDKIGGYPKGAILDYLDSENNNFLKVQSLIDDNTYNFVETPSYIDDSKWKLLNFGGANVALSNLSGDGVDKINQLKALETGNVSNDTDAYLAVEKYAHSTFDKSKFTITGSPTISDDGVMSNCSKGNAINANISLSDLKGKSWKIKGSSILGTSIHTLVKLSSIGESNYFNFGSIIFTPSANRISFNLRTGDNNNSSEQGVKIYKDGFNSGDNVYYTISFDIETGTYYLYVDKIDGSTLAGTWVATSTNKELYYINTHPEFKISYGAGSDSVNYLTTGSIDLKSIAVWADCVPVFNGNKTGLDVIKPDNFEKVGSPTISEDGLLDGNLTDTSNYVLANISLGSISKLKIKGSLIYTNQSTTQQVFSFDGNNLRLIVSEAGSFSLYSSALLATISGTNFTNYSNKKIDFEVTIDGTNVTLLVVTEDNQFSANGTVSSIDYSGVTKCGIGSTYAGVEPYKGLIDLNSFKVYVDGNLVYQPCLKIPYTLSKTGSKIVDAYARNRVQSLYEQTGEALYYTIDEQNKNFTLPMGEVYGMIEQSRSLNDKITNYILEAPNGVATYSDSVIIAKQGLKAISANGVNADGTINNFEIILTSDISVNISAYANDFHYFFVYKNKNESNYKIIGRLHTQYFVQEVEPTLSGDWTWYNPKTKIWKNKYSGEIKEIVAVKIAEGFIKSNKIDSLLPYQPLELCSINTDQVITGKKIFYDENANYGSLSRVVFKNEGYAGIVLQSTLIDKQTPAVDTVKYHGIEFADKNSNRLAYFGVRNSTDSNITSIELQNLNNGGFLFPRCTTKATTVSTASDDKVAVVVRNYSNGNSWYRVWSDSWIEQGGLCSAFEGDTRYCNVTYPLAFSNNNYNIVVCANRAVMGNDSSSWVFSKTNTGARLANAQTGVPTFWYACGY